jgi:threonine synthase
MKFYSTRDIGQSKGVSLQHAVLKGLADDEGLYMPEYIPSLEKDFINNIHKYSLKEIAFTVANAFIGNDVPEEILKSLISEVMNFEIPLVELEKEIFSLELYHGPTMAFKDVGARFMARLMGYFTAQQKQELKVIVSTSGDTGSAVAAGFYKVPGIKVYILYPQGNVSILQEKQLTTWNENITAIEVKGTFDDCQRLSKQLLSDKKLNSENILTSANSINIARLIPQSFYYFWAYAQVKPKQKPVVISVPSGNFGNLTAGILAKQMGLPIDYFVGATNINDVVPTYLHSGIYQARPAIQTISNAMDVGSPSNFERLNYLFDGQLEIAKQFIKGFSYTDEVTEKTMKKIFDDTGYMLDPHGAVAYLGLKAYMKENDAVGVFLETAHPAKFLEVVERVLNVSVLIPPALQLFSQKQKNAFSAENNYEMIKEYILSN